MSSLNTSKTEAVHEWNHLLSDSSTPASGTQARCTGHVWGTNTIYMHTQTQEVSLYHVRPLVHLVQYVWQWSAAASQDFRDGFLLCICFFFLLDPCPLMALDCSGLSNPTCNYLGLSQIEWRDKYIGVNTWILPPESAQTSQRLGQV